MFLLSLFSKKVFSHYFAVPLYHNFEYCSVFVYGRFNDPSSSSTFDLLTVFVCNGIQGIRLLALRQLMLMRKCLKRKKMERLQLVKRILLILLKMKLSMNRNLNTGKLSRKIRRTSLAGHISYNLWSKRYVLNTSTFALILITWKKQLLLNFINSCFT